MQGTRSTNSRGCVFCTRRDQPAILFETPSLYVMPDKFPTVPGHTLIISKRHLACYGAGSAQMHRELDEAAKRTRQFLEGAYGKRVLAFENGVAGQSVFHAHLHLLPAQILRFPIEAAEHEDVTRIRDWQAVQEHYSRHGNYRYVEVDGERYLVSGYSPVIGVLRRMLAEATGLTWGEHGPVKTTTTEDMREVERRWRVQDWEEDMVWRGPDHPGTRL